MAAQRRYRSTSGSIFAMLFGAVAIVGVIGVAANTLIRGPMSSMADVTRRTVAENSMIANSRLAIIMAGTQTTPDCDGDTMIEPLPYTNAGALPKPTGGGYLPSTMGASLTDPWGTQYGYCVWDHGSSVKVAGCGGAGALRLAGTNAKTYTSIAIISAGKDRVFQTSCAAFVNAATPLVNKPAGSDDIMITHTYAEMEAIGGDGIWRRKDASTADIDKDVEIRSAANAVTARIEKETGYGMFNSIYVDNILKRTAARITVADETLFNTMVGFGLVADGSRVSIGNGGLRIDRDATYDIWIQGGGAAAAGQARNLALLGIKASDILYLNYGSEYAGGTVIGGPATVAAGGLTVNTGGITAVAGGVTVTAGGITLNGGNLHLANNAITATYSGATQTIRDANGGWVRTYGNTGWYNQTHGGGMFMDSASYVRTYGSKPLMAPSFYDENNAGFYLDPNGNSVINTMHASAIYDREAPATYYLDMNNTSIMENLQVNIMYDRYNTGYYVQPRGTNILNDVRANVFYDQGNTGFYMVPRGTSVMNVTYMSFIYDRDNNGYYWDGNGTSSNNVIYAYAYYYHSDARKKKNIVTITPEEVNKLYKLRGVNFDWKESGKHDIGLIAQEVQEVFPELVSQLREDELGVQYGNFIPLLIEASKHQKAELETYKKGLESALKRLTEQETRIQKLEQALLAKPSSMPVAPPPPVAPQPAQQQPVAQGSTGLIAQPKVDISKIKGADDIGICPKVTVPPCVLKQTLTNAEEFSCRVEMSAYIHTAKIYGLCVKENKEALEKLRTEYNNTIAKAVEKKFGLNDTDFNEIGYSQVLGLQHILSGATNAAPPAPIHVPEPAEQPAPLETQPEAAPTPQAPSLAPPQTTSPAGQVQEPQPVTAAPEQKEINAVQTSPALQNKAVPSDISPLSSETSYPYVKWLPYAGIIAGLAILLFGIAKGRKKP